jgi:glycosyltransferase involved in cell wall biosynthesis
MKILLVITKSDIGGAQVFVISLARALRDLGHDVEVTAGDGDFLFEELKKYSIPCHYVKSLKRDYNIFNSFSFLLDLYRLIKANKYEVVHLNSSNALIGAFSSYFFKSSPKMVFTLHGLSFLDKNYEMNPVFRLLSRLYFKFFLLKVDARVFVSNSNYYESVESSIAKDGKVIYYGLDEGEMNFLTRKEALEFLSEICKTELSNSFIIGSAGRLAYQKNYDFLIRNFSQIKKAVPDAKLILIGDGPYYERFAKEIKKRGFENDFFLVGAIKNSYRYFKAFDVFTLPSHYEGLPISLIEAVMAEIPILASDVGGNSENVNGNAKQLFQLNNAGDYINKLIIVKKENEDLRKFNALLKEKFSLQSMALSYQSLYEELVKKQLVC